MNVALEISPSAESTPLILIVDDDVISNLMLSEVLGKDGYKILVVNNGQAALTACQNAKPDIILMDAVMPIMNGFDCCQTLHEVYGAACPPILMITGLNDSESVDRAYEVGAMDYVTKPFHWAVLRGRIRQAISTHLAHVKIQHALSKERLLRQELKLVNQQLHRLATIDDLTNIANRRVFNEKLDNEWQRLQRERSPLGLILIDIDCFKAYNDTYGHLGGDSCLRQVAHVIRDSVRRPADMAARYGGEEFAIILPNTDLEGVIYIGETVQKALQAKAIPHGSSTVRSWVTVSIGVTAIVPAPPHSPQTLISWVDQALYDAKDRGRDQIIAYSTLKSSIACDSSSSG